jgi:membrane protein implicated in regulation of membrane protease activity
MFSFHQLFVIVGLLLALLELVLGVATGFDLVLVGTILIISGVVGGIFGNIYITLGNSILLGISYLFFGRSFVKKKIIVITHHTNIDKLIGQTGIVIRSITPDTPGLIRLADEDWRASSDEIIYEKAKVEVQNIEGVTLIVKKK